LDFLRLKVSQLGGSAAQKTFVQRTWVQADLSAIQIQLAQYKAANGFYPTTEQGITALVIEPTSSPIPKHWKQLFHRVPKDPWQNDYVYRCPGRIYPNAYDLFSAGPDKTRNTAGDITISPSGKISP
jgi:general secretion pathway protein G